MPENNQEKPYILTGYISNVPDTYENIQNDYNSGNISADEMMQRARNVDYNIQQQANNELWNQYFRNAVAGGAALASIPLGPVAGGALTSGAMSWASGNELPKVALDAALGAAGGKVADLALKPVFGLASNGIQKLSPHVESFMNKLKGNPQNVNIGAGNVNNINSPIKSHYSSMGGDAIRGGDYVKGSASEYMDMLMQEAREAAKNNTANRLGLIAKLESEMTGRPLQEVRDELAHAIQRNAYTDDPKLLGYYSLDTSNYIMPEQFLELAKTGSMPFKSIAIAPYSKTMQAGGLSPYEVATHEAMHRLGDKVSSLREVAQNQYITTTPAINMSNKILDNYMIDRGLARTPGFSPIEGWANSAMTAAGKPFKYEPFEKIGRYGGEVSFGELNKNQLYNQYLDDVEVLRKIYNNYRAKNIYRGTNKW